MAQLKTSAKRIIMSRSVAKQWLLKRATPEYRFRVFNPNAKDYPSVLRSFRDGRLKMSGVSPIPDLGVKEEFGSFYVWSSQREPLETLKEFFELRGLETSWIW